MHRIGVFVCHCGTNIAATVDVKQVAEAMKQEPGVVFSTDYQYMCSEGGQTMIQDTIRDQKLTGVVVCSCSPRMHEATFRKAAAKAGLNSYMVEIANIREQCSWIHKDIMSATEKAIILARTAVAKVQLNAPLIAGESPLPSVPSLSAAVSQVCRLLLISLRQASMLISLRSSPLSAER